MWLRWVFVVVVVGGVAIATGMERLSKIPVEPAPCGPDLAIVGLDCKR